MAAPRATPWRSLLAPWEAAAKSLGGLPISVPEWYHNVAREIGSDGVVWIEWNAKLTDANALLRDLECMELLHLLARVDREVFSEFVHLVCDKDEGGQLLHYVQSDESKRDFCFGYRVVVQSLDTLTSLAVKRLVMGYSDAEHSHGFCDVKKRLLRELETKPERSGEERAQVPVEIDCAVPGVGCDEKSIILLVQLVALQDAMQGNGGGKPSCGVSMMKKHVFRIEGVHINTLREAEDAALIIPAIAKIVELGVEITYLSIHQISFDSLDPDVMTLCLHQLFAPSQSCHKREAIGRWGRVRGIRHLFLAVFVAYPVYRRLFSAIAHSQSLQMLTITSGAITRRDVSADGLKRRLQWLGVALFGPHATHSIKKFFFTAKSDLMASSSVLTEALDHPYPMSCLDIAVKETHIADISPSTKIWLQGPPTTTSNPDEAGMPFVVFASGLESVHVINSDAHWVSIFLPGWGEAWVSAEIVGSSLRQPIATGTRLHGIPHIIVNDLCPSSREATIRLFQTIGAKIERLDVVGAEGELPGELLTALLKACPALNELQLAEVELATISPIFDGYNSNTNSISRLALRGVFIPDGEFAKYFNDYLGDSSSAYWTVLRELWVDQLTEGRNFDSKDNYAFLEKLLNQCPRLAKLHVVVPRGIFKSFKLSQAEFDRHNGKPTAVRKAPLATASKIAFLSCRSATHSIGSDVVAAIFQYAAEPMARQCAIYSQTRDYYPLVDSDSE